MKNIEGWRGGNITLRELNKNIETVINNEKYYNLGDIDLTDIIKIYGTESLLDEKFLLFLGVGMKFKKEVLKDDNINFISALEMLAQLN